MLSCIANQQVSYFVHAFSSSLLFHDLQNIPVQKFTHLIIEVDNHESTIQKFDNLNKFE